MHSLSLPPVLMEIYLQPHHGMIKKCHILLDPLNQIKASSENPICQNARKIQSEIPLLQLPQKNWVEILGNYGRKTAGGDPSSLLSALFTCEVSVV